MKKQSIVKSIRICQAILDNKALMEYVRVPQRKAIHNLIQFAIDNSIMQAAKVTR